MKKLFAFVLDCNHHLICLVNQIRGRGEDRRRSGKEKKSSKNAKYLDYLDRPKICLTLYYIKKTGWIGFENVLMFFHLLKMVGKNAQLLAPLFTRKRLPNDSIPNFCLLFKCPLNLRGHCIWVLFDMTSIL